MNITFSRVVFGRSLACRSITQRHYSDSKEKVSPNYQRQFADSYGNQNHQYMPRGENCVTPTESEKRENLEKMKEANASDAQSKEDHPQGTKAGSSPLG